MFDMYNVFVKYRRALNQVAYSILCDAVAEQLPDEYGGDLLVLVSVLLRTY